MAGFKSFADLAKARDEGRVHSCSFMKTASAAPAANWNWVDMSLGAGNPVPQYYAASPLEAAVLTGRRGLYHGDDKSPYKKFLKAISVNTTSANLVGKYLLADYLLFYPFLDGTSLDEQILTNDVALPRYATEGGSVIAVATAATTGTAYFDMRYVNQDGVEKTTGYVNRANSSSGVGSLVHTYAGILDGTSPFLRLAEGDTGVRRILSVTFQAPVGGLIAFVIIKPLLKFSYLEYPNTTEKEFPFGMPAPVEIQDGAYLNFLASTAGSVASGTMVGRADFAWSK